jgi:hypothetical protein
VRANAAWSAEHRAPVVDGSVVVVETDVVLGVDVELVELVVVVVVQPLATSWAWRMARALASVVPARADRRAAHRSV